MFSHDINRGYVRVPEKSQNLNYKSVFKPKLTSKQQFSLVIR